MADQVLANLSETCRRFERHVYLKEESKKFYKAMTKKDITFINDWISAEVWNMNGKYWKHDDPAKVLLKTWTKLFEKAPVTKKSMYVYRAVFEQHAIEIIRAKTGTSIVLDRYSSFSHSPDMVRKYASLSLQSIGDSDIDICIMCIKIPKGTKYAFLSGIKREGGWSAFDKDNEMVENIDKTQGELILNPMTLIKKKNERTSVICEGKYRKKISVVTLTIAQITKSQSAAVHERSW